MYNNGTSFNPCFNGYYTYTIAWTVYRLADMKVSILVLMDITLILHHLGKTKLLSKGFNPCFNGYYTYTSIAVSSLISSTKFQSLF